MTTLTVPTQPEQDHALRPVPWRRMGWVTWRQHRPTLISLPALLGAVAVFLWIAGLRVHHDYAALAACRPFSSSACQALNTSFSRTDWTMGNTIHIVLQLAPALIGAFAGAPLLARELETGTFRHAWTQGFGRERWAIAKLVLLAVAITAAAEAFSQVFTWFFQPFIGQQSLTVLSAGVFDTRGIDFAAWTLAAFTIGALAGMVIRRILPAMAVTLGAYLSLDLLTWLVLRPHYPLARVTSNPRLFSGQGSASSPWLLSTWWTGPGGRPANQAVVSRVLNLFPHNGPPTVNETPAQAFAQHGITQWWRYIPVSRFWPMQFIESGWLFALSVLLASATVWLVRRRAS
ncbi:MAG TPA: hypothetical protein VK836_17680 [Streptosporangiaceae bacterium]|nr:hypothetical protein [Streptosporangiaceae bacterium]